MKRLLVFMSLLLAACGERPADQVETLTVVSSEFAISLVSRGELRAAGSTPITPPPGSRNPRTINFLVPDSSWVTKGQVVARFDVSAAELGARGAGIEIDKVDLQVMAKQRELDRLLAELGNELDLVDIEKIMAEQFSFDNELAYSRHEIIDAMRDRELLDYRSGHLEDKKGTYSERQGAEVAVLSAARATQESQFEEHRQMLEQSEVRAPHDGYFVYERTWFRQKIDVGSTVFPGNKFASIPNLEKMEAVLNVPEKEAVGLDANQSVRVVIDAYPDRPLDGTVSSVSATAAPIDRDSPVKYFTVVVSLEEADPEWITPEAPVTAEIFINRIEDAISVPNQAIFNGSSGDWVLLRDGRDLVRQPVSLGVRGANRSQVIDGLEAGDEIALFPPADFES
ncbi:MAG: HlyD family efflux transporter periplasmic adaptor subunit [Xanthomonadales bacterium]|nr:HlyD family efflux transporter periplasmic adaptor subunit [Xanthomonadales bacterium]NIX12188.1 HlyD family efflux transporter periplasmic adaptor subunit [Xanthomonadales bacterium]